MATHSGYRWDSLGSGSGIRSTTSAWDLRWWILLAVLTSAVVHAGLFLALKKMKLPGSESRPDRIEARTGPFQTEIERVAVSDAVLRDMSPQTPDLTQKTMENQAVTVVPDVTQIAEAIKDRDVILTPAMETPTVNVTLSTPAPGSPGDLIDNISDMRSAPRADTKKELMEQASAMRAAHSPDDDRALLDAGASGLGETSVKDDIISALKKGTGGNGGVDGFTNLDDLVNHRGPIQEDFKTMLRTDLLFAFGSAELRGDAKISLMKLGAIIQNNSGAVFRLVGHTDSIGDAASNQTLSEARARVVRDWLVNVLRIDGTNVIAEGRGESEPAPGVNQNGTPDEQAVSRRVEIHKTAK